MSTTFIAPELGNIEAAQAFPFYFGQQGNECLGWLHRPSPAKARNLGVVMCNPLGYDVMSAHRSYRYMATRLAAEGIASLRFDYPSTGDSAGYVDDPDRVAAWLESIRHACCRLHELSGIESIVLFGLRSGGTLAAAAAVGIDNIAGFASWAPFSSGSLLLRESRALASLNAHFDGNLASITRPDGGVHVAGFGMSAQTVKDLEAISLTKRAKAPAPRCLLMHRDDLPVDSRLEKHWSGLGSEITCVAVPGYVPMMRDAFESQLPLAATETLVSWVCGLDAADTLLPTTTDLPKQCCLLAAGDEARTPVMERTIWFGPSRTLSGVISLPQSGSLRKKTAILFPTVGANHRIGSNRLHVELGRELAAMGYLCLRMDIDGAGESGTVCERERFWEYKSDTYLDVVEGTQWLRDQPGVEGCVLWGICSGAYMAYHAAQADESVHAALLFNLQLFSWREDEIKENVARNQAKSFGFYRQAALKPETWKRLFRGGIHLRVILMGLSARVKKRAKARAALMWGKWSAGADGPARQVAHLSRRGCRVSFICTPEDTGLHEIKSHLGANAVQVTHLPGIEYVELGHDTGADHTFTSAASQQWVKNWTRHYLLQHFP